MALRLLYQDLTTRLTTHELARPLASRRNSRVPRRTDELRVRHSQGWQHAARDPGNGWLSGRFAGARPGRRVTRFGLQTYRTGFDLLIRLLPSIIP